VHPWQATATIILALTAAPVTAIRAQDRNPDWGIVEFDRDRGLTSGTVPGPADSVWRVLRTAVDAAGIKVTVEQRAGGRIGNQRFRAVRRLGNEPLSRLFSCGNSTTGPNADNYHVFIGLLAVLTPIDGNRTRLELQVTAEAIDVPGGRSERVGCYSTGRLEFGLIERLDAAFPGTR
jgi:hypothetical protein